MINFSKKIIIVATVIASYLLVAPGSTVLAAGGCSGTDSNFFGFPTWYRGLNCSADGAIEIKGEQTLNTVAFKVGLNIADIAIRLSGIVAVGFIVYSGYAYITSQGDKSRVETAKKTLQTAVVGLVITVMAAAIIGFIVYRINLN